MTTQIDAGEIIHQEKISLDPDITYDLLYKKLSLLSVKVLKITMEYFFKNKLLQNVEDIYKIKNFHTRKIKKENLYIDWKKNSSSIYNLIRGLKNKPAAHTVYNNNPIKIYTAEILNDFEVQDLFQPGEIVTADRKNGIIIKTGDGFLKIIELQKQNKKILNYKDFLNGTKLKIKEKFQNVEN